MRNIKKIIAFVVASTMIVGSSMTAFAADTDITTNTGEGAGSEATGTGSSAWYDTNVMKVVVPTLAGAFDYKVDPEGAVSQSKNWEGTTVTSVEDSTGLVFKNTVAENSYKVTNSSDPFTLTNKSAIPVEVSVTYKVAAADSNPLAIDNFSTTADFSNTTAAADNSSKALYLALKPSNDKTQVFNKEATGQSFTTTLLTGFDGYKVDYDSTNKKYTFAADEDYKNWPTSEFVLTGAINKDLPLSTWYTTVSNTDTMLNVPKVSVTYKFTAVKDALDASAYLLDNDLYIWKTTAADFMTDGEFVSDTNNVLEVYINGKAITSPAIDTQYKGHVKLSLEQIATAFGYTWADMTDAEKTELKTYIKTFKVGQGKNGTASAKYYYGEL